MDAKSSSATLPGHGTPQIDPGENRSCEESGLSHSDKNRQTIAEAGRPATGTGRSARRFESNPKNHSGKSRQKKRPESGRSKWSRNKGDRRARNDEAQETAKRRRLNQEEDRKLTYAVEFSKEEIEAEERRPKRKVAIMIGYSGSGYRGMQLNDSEKTIEGDLFKAFVAAGAISKANANDPKKSALVRCARTDKGVHAVGNVISMKLIIEDKDIIKRINDNLSPQIRVWGIERTNGGFSAYHLCDSRIYEYLIPTHCFLPPHPNSFLGKKLFELADKAEDRPGYEERQQEVATFWQETDNRVIRPILERLDPELRALVQEALNKPAEGAEVFGPGLQPDTSKVDSIDQNHATAAGEIQEAEEIVGNGSSINSAVDSGAAGSDFAEGLELTHGTSFNGAEPTTIEIERAKALRKLSPLEVALKEVRTAYTQARKAYRIHPTRLARIRSSLSRYIGTHNYHNYTIHKTFQDPSAKRIIKSFVADEKPIIINNTEWLSLKVHGQSFMMHQIRKMVGMVALLVRCGCHEGRIQDSYTSEKLTIPRTPGLGLLLERPVFDTYNERMKGENDRNPINFDRYEKEINEFKQREIYERIFKEEERDSLFGVLFTTIDNTKSPNLLYLSSMGIVATKQARDEKMDKNKQTENLADGESSDNDANAGDS